MVFDEIFIGRIESLGPIRFSKSFGWICIHTGKNMFGGYKIIDNGILIMWLIVSPRKFKEALQSRFEKFDFGKTWVQTEVVGEQDLDRVWPFILDAFNFTKIRRSKSKFLKKT